MLLFYFQSYTQDDVHKNSVQVSAGSAVIPFSGHLSYDRLLIKKETGFFKSYYLTLKAGRLGAFTFTPPGVNSILTSINCTGLTGLGKDHLEFGLGLGYHIAKNTSDEYTDRFSTNFFYPSFYIGYRKIKDKYIFRTGIGIAEWVYVGVGYNF